MTLGYRTLRPGLFRGLWTGSCGSRMFRNDTCLASASSVRGEPPSSGRPRGPNGTKFGRPRKVQAVQDIATAKRVKEVGHTIKDIAKYFGVSRATLYRYFTQGGAA